MENYKELFSILRGETKPALGCTGPIGACYVAAQAYDAIGGEIKKITVYGASAKSDDVAFPGTEYLGVEMAYALGAVCGDPNAGLEVLHTVTPECEVKARKVAELVELNVSRDHTSLDFEKKVVIETDKGVGTAIVKGAPDGLIYKARNDEVLLEKEVDPYNRAGKSPLIKYKVADIFDFASTYPAEEFDFLDEAVEMNMKMAEYVIEHEEVGIGIGRELLNEEEATSASRAKAYSALACEGRMAGVNLPIMSVAGKGNVGVASTVPIISLARDFDSDRETLNRALAASILMSTAVIHRIGKAPTMCSCEVAASIGVTVGTVLLKGGTASQAETAIQNLIPNVFGVVCDGAKLACALRMASSTAMAIDSANLALRDVRLANNQGVLDVDADASIDFLGRFALESMISSDKELNNAMFEKRNIFPLMTFNDRQKQ